MMRSPSGRRVLVTAQSSALAGVERRLLQEVQLLRGLGATVIAAPSRFPRGDQFRASLSAAGAQVIEWHPYKFIERRQPGFPFPQLFAMSRSRAALAGLHLAHVAMPWTTVGLSRVLALAEVGVPVVLGLHCTYDRASWPTALAPHLARALRGVVGGYAVSECVKQSFLQNFGHWLDSVLIDVVHNGVDTHRFAPDPSHVAAVRERWSIPADAPLMVFCGRLDPFKNPEFTLDIFEQICGQLPQVHLLMVGDGPLGEAMQRRVQNSGILRTRVHLLGYVESVESLLQASDIYISTSSSHEGFPLAPSEALACGLPIIVPDLPVFREAFGVCAAASLVRGQDAAVWAAAVVQCLHQAGPLRRDAARAYAEQRLTLEAMQGRLRAFYGRWL